MNIEKYKHIPYTVRENCVICGSKLDKPIINLPNFPLTEIFVNYPIEELLGYVNQSFHHCNNCGMGLLSNIISSEFLYGSKKSYYFRTSKSISGKETTDYFLNFVNKVIGNKRFEFIAEIGCNDIYLLKKLYDKANKFIGIDPISDINQSKDNILIINDKYENIRLPKEVDLVICKDTLEHIEEPRLFLEKMMNESSDDTLFIFQFPLFDILLEEKRFDQIFHQHLNYFSLQSIFYLLRELGCELMECDINRMHWGAILIAFKKGKIHKHFRTVSKISDNDIIENYSHFKNQMNHINNLLETYSQSSVYGYGAALMLPVLSYYLHNDLSSIKYILDDDEKKEGLHYINLDVDIKHNKDIEDIKNKTILITAISSKINVRKMMTKLIQNEPKHIIVPIPIF